MAKTKAAKKKPRETGKVKAGKVKAGARRKSAAKARMKGARKAVKKSSRGRGGVQLGVSMELDTRLRTLATQMGKTLEEVLIQALTEFADNWEDHLHVVKNLNAGDDRMQLSVRDEESAT